MVESNFRQFRSRDLTLVHADDIVIMYNFQYRH